MSGLITKVSTGKQLYLIAISGLTESKIIFDIPVDPMDMDQFDGFGSSERTEYLVNLEGGAVSVFGVLRVIPEIKFTVNHVAVKQLEFIPVEVAA